MRTNTTACALVACATAVALAGTACGQSDSVRRAERRADLVGFGSCSVQPERCNTGRPAPGGTLALGLSRKIGTLSPLATDPAEVDDQAGAVMALVAPGAFVAAPGGELQYNRDLLASEPSVIATDPHTVVYRIRPRAMWSDGTPITSDDFVYNWRLRTAETLCGSESERRRYSTIASVTGQDSGRTVRVTFAAPHPDWRTLFTPLLPWHVAAAGRDLSSVQGLAASCEVWRATPTWSGGPYQVATFTPDQQVELVPNPQWYGSPRPVLERIVLKGYGDREAAVAALERAEVMAVDLQPDRVAVGRLRSMASGGVGFALVGGRTWLNFMINSTGAALADPLLRQAILSAVNVNEIVQRAVRDYYPAAVARLSHHLAPGAPGYPATLTRVAPEQGSGNADLARTILRDGGYTLTDGGITTPGQTALAPLALVYRESSTEQAEVAALIREQLARAGVPATVRAVADLDGALSVGDFDLAIREEADGPLVSTVRGRWRWSAEDQRRGPTGWRTPESDSLLDQVATELDRARSLELLGRHDEVLTAAAVALPLYQRPLAVAAVAGVVNLRPNGFGPVTYNGQTWGLARRAPGTSRVMR